MSPIPPTAQPPRTAISAFFHQHPRIELELDATAARERAAVERERWERRLLLVACPIAVLFAILLRVSKTHFFPLTHALPQSLDTATEWLIIPLGILGYLGFGVGLLKRLVAARAGGS